MNGMDYTKDPRAVLIHFNPNHDKLGRFTKSPSGIASGNSVDKVGSTGYNKSEGIDKTKIKKYAKIGAGIVAASLVVAGGVYLAKSGKFNDMVNAGRELTANTLNEVGSASIFDADSKGKSIKPQPNSTGRTHDKIDFDMIQRLNGQGPDSEPGRDINCAQTSMAYILNSMFGEKVDAKPYVNDLELTTMFPDLRISKYGWSREVFKEIFDNAEYKSCKPNIDTLSSVLSKQSPGTGIIDVFNGSFKHFIVYEKPEKGDISIIDGQSGNFVWGNAGIEYIQQMFGWVPTAIIDVTNASLKTTDDAKMIINSMVKKV